MHFEQRLNYKFNFKCMFNDFQDFQGFQDYGHIYVCQFVRESVTVSPVLSHRRLKKLYQEIFKFKKKFFKKFPKSKKFFDGIISKDLVQNNRTKISKF